MFSALFKAMKECTVYHESLALPALCELLHGRNELFSNYESKSLVFFIFSLTSPSPAVWHSTVPLAVQTQNIATQLFRDITAISAISTGIQI